MRIPIILISIFLLLTISHLHGQGFDLQIGSHYFGGESGERVSTTRFSTYTTLSSSEDSIVRTRREVETTFNEEVSSDITLEIGVGYNYHYFKENVFRFGLGLAANSLKTTSVQTGSNASVSTVDEERIRNFLGLFRCDEYDGAPFIISDFDNISTEKSLDIELNFDIIFSSMFKDISFGFGSEFRIPLIRKVKASQIRLQASEENGMSICSQHRVDLDNKEYNRFAEVNLDFSGYALYNLNDKFSILGGIQLEFGNFSTPIRSSELDGLALSSSRVERAASMSPFLKLRYQLGSKPAKNMEKGI